MYGFSNSGLRSPANCPARIYLVIVVFTALFMTIPALGLAPFSTKGEPREAIVALQMLDSGDWILPVDSNGDIPYKPPMLYWCMAAADSLPAYSPEFTFRLPSAIAFIGLICLTFWFTNAFAPGAGKRVGLKAFIAAMLLLTASETWRAGINARVDMVNTFFMVGAMMSFFRWFHRKSFISAVSAVLCMSCAVLTKGPVGILLPAFTGLVFAMHSGMGFVRAAWRIFLACAGACILPALWYYAAYQRGGDAFLELVLEENFGRFLGRMSYRSHENGLWYYFAMLPAGWLPWTLMGVFSLFSLRGCGTFSARGLGKRLRDMAPADFFALASAAIIFVFYCVPKSKRGVYILPMYPFVAYLLADWIIILIARGKRCVTAYCSTIAAISALVGVALCVAPLLTLNTALEALFPSPGTCIPPLFGAFVGFWAIRRGKTDDMAPLMGSFVTVIILYLTYFVFINPLIAMAKTDRSRAAEICLAVPEGEKIYAHNPSRFDRWYSLTFYMPGRIIPIVPNANYSNLKPPYDTPDEAARVATLLSSSEGAGIYYLTGASQRGSATLRDIAAMADTAVVYESEKRSADLKERPVVYHLTRSQATPSSARP